MCGEDTIKVEGIIVDVLPKTRFRVELPNGHKLLARISGKTRSSFVGLLPGDNVTIEMSPYDLSTGCIVGRER
jgi:translation initiation factor IF-1